MTLLHFLKALQKEEGGTWQKTCEGFAKSLSIRGKKISWKTVDNIAHSRKKVGAGAVLASRIVYASAGMVKFEELRPDILIFLKKCGKEKHFTISKNLSSTSFSEGGKKC